MFVTANIEELRKRISSAKANRVSFIPTMGALHKGHLSLVRAARAQSDFVVVSILVNPTQFAPGEDLKSYPRNFKKDRDLLRKESVDLVFNPTVKTIYPDDFSTFVQEQDLSRHLCAKSRPNHFRGVATIVVKLFNIITPDVVYFGQKDYQQAKIIQAVIRDLNFPIKIKILPIVRESSGLALSSRNEYLTARQKNEALILYKALELAKKKIKQGERDSRKIIHSLKRLISSVKSAKIDYLEIVDPESLEKVKTIKGRVLISLAVYLEKVRLIDNTLLNAK